MNTKAMIQCAAGVALLLSGLALARSAYACPVCLHGNLTFPIQAQGNWNSVVNVLCPNNGNVCGQGIGSGNSMAAVVANQSNFAGLPVGSACTDAFAYASDNRTQLGFAEETNFGSSVINTVGNGAAKLYADLWLCAQ
jgi:hypothetical protein